MNGFEPRGRYAGFDQIGLERSRLLARTNKGEIPGRRLDGGLERCAVAATLGGDHHIVAFASVRWHCIAVNQPVGLAKARVVGHRGADGDEEAHAPGKVGESDGDRRRAADQEVGSGQDRLHKYIHGSLARAMVAGIDDPVAGFPCLDPVLRQLIAGLDADKPRLAIGQRFACRLEHGAAGAAAADPSLGDGAVGQDQRLGAGFRGGDGHRAHHGCQRERLTPGLVVVHQIQNIGVLRHDHILAR